MGILSAVFGRKKSENTSTDRYKLYDALKTYARIESSIADRISKSIEEGGDVVFPTRKEVPTHRKLSEFQKIS